MYRSLFLLLFLAACLGSTGCTRKAWYDAMQERQRQECYRIQNPRAAQQCLEKANALTYDQYDRARGEALERP